MRFSDRAMLRTLDDLELSSLLTLAVGRSLLDAAFVFEHVDIGDVASVEARAISVAPELVAGRAVELVARESGSGREWQLLGSIGGTQPAPLHALLEVSVTAAARGVTTSVVSVESDDLGHLREEVLAAVDWDAALAALAAWMPESTPEALADVLARRGVDELGALRRSFTAPNEPSRLLLTLVSDATTAASPRTFRVTALAHAVDALGTDLARGLATIAAARSSTERIVDPPAEPRGARLRVTFPAFLVFPADDLDDADLPVADGAAPGSPAVRRAARLTELTIRLRRAGVVPLAV